MKQDIAAKAKIKAKEPEALLGPDGNYYQVRRLMAVKLKDKSGRGGVHVDLRKLGYIPDVLVIQKIQGKNNQIVVSALIMKGGPKNEN